MSSSIIDSLAGRGSCVDPTSAIRLLANAPVAAVGMHFKAPVQALVKASPGSLAAEEPRQLHARRRNVADRASSPDRTCDRWSPSAPAPRHQRAPRPAAVGSALSRPSPGDGGVPGAEGGALGRADEAGRSSPITRRARVAAQAARHALVLVELRRHSLHVTGVSTHAPAASSSRGLRGIPTRAAFELERGRGRRSQ